MSVEPSLIDITPSVADVAALLRARTKDVDGNEIGTFNDDTRPTSSQTITLIDDVVADIQGGSRRAPAGRRATGCHCVTSKGSFCPAW